jgi:hypothetical protein
LKRQYNTPALETNSGKEGLTPDIDTNKQPGASAKTFTFPAVAPTFLRPISSRPINLEGRTSASYASSTRSQAKPGNSQNRFTEKTDVHVQLSDQRFESFETLGANMDVSTLFSKLDYDTPNPTPKPRYSKARPKSKVCGPFNTRSPLHWESHQDWDDANEATVPGPRPLKAYTKSAMPRYDLFVGKMAFKMTRSFGKSVLPVGVGCVIASAGALVDSLR